MTTKEKEVILKMLALYKDMPFMYDKTHQDYTNKTRRTEAYEILLDVYTLFDPCATTKTLGKKISNMRTNYIQETRKVQASIKSGGELYVPSLWYYNAFSFLGSHIDPSWSPGDHNGTATDPLDTDNDVTNNSDTEDVKRTSSISQINRVKRRLMLRPRPSMPESTKRFITNVARRDEQWETYGRSIGFQVKDLSGTQLVICQKLISDVIFYAKLNKLNENSQVVNPEEEPMEHISYIESEQMDVIKG